MGSGISNPVDESTRQEVSETIKTIVKTFTLNYTKEYALALVEKVKEDADKLPSEYVLLQRQVSNLFGHSKRNLSHN